MRCPDCNSQYIYFVASSGYAGYRCRDCGKWNYEEKMKADYKREPEKLYRCRHCGNLYQEYRQAFDCCNPK